MTQQNTHQEIKSASTVGDRNTIESKEDTVVQSNTQKSSYLEKFCDSNPGAAQCRVYDV